MENPAEQLMANDLARSGLLPNDIQARIMTTAERGASQVAYSTHGYVIPYFQLDGQREAFYRLRIFEDEEVLDANHRNGIKYKQAKDTPNHVYFPPHFKKVLAESNRRWIFITEGEKKSACATKFGFPTVGFAGVDSWRSNLLELPTDSEIITKGDTKEQKQYLKLPKDAEFDKEKASYAVGFDELIQFILQYDLKVFICYDTDNPQSGYRPEVQRAAYSLGVALRTRGVSTLNIRQLTLPFQAPKMGLDDFLVDHGGSSAFLKVVNSNLERRVAFPRHPDIRTYLRKKLRGRLDRDKLRELATACIVQMDADGRRILSDGDRPYYFDNVRKRLIRVEFNELTDATFASTQWAKYLYQVFGLGQPDSLLLRWINSEFMAAEPIDRSRTYRLIARHHTDADQIAYQISNEEYAVADADGLKIFDNGTNGIMFASDDSLVPIDPLLLTQAFHELSKKPLTPWWYDVFQDVRLANPEHDSIMGTILFYVSPWLNRWRNTQLPIEMALGEAGSGKSTLYTLRLTMLEGHATLRNMPNDIRDWYASISNAGGFHVTDNVHSGTKDVRQRMSDDLCRIVTETNPTIEMRQLYTEDKQIRLPIHCIMGFTAIQQPFYNADIFQRAVILELDKTKALKDGRYIEYDMNWVTRHLDQYGGRTYWVAHHLLVLHRFFKACQTAWRTSYRSSYRLTNVEQIFHIMGNILSLDTSQVVKGMTKASSEAILETDWVYKGIHAFVEYYRQATQNPDAMFSCSDIAGWAEAMDEFRKSEILTNAFRLTKYMKSHAGDLQVKLGIQETKRNNLKMFKLLPKPPE